MCLLHDPTFPPIKDDRSRPRKRLHPLHRLLHHRRSTISPRHPRLVRSHPPLRKHPRPHGRMVHHDPRSLGPHIRLSILNDDRATSRRWPTRLHSTTHPPTSLRPAGRKQRALRQGISTPGTLPTNSEPSHIPYSGRQCHQRGSATMGARRGADTGAAEERAPSGPRGYFGEYRGGEVLQERVFCSFRRQYVVPQHSTAQHSTSFGRN